MEQFPWIIAKVGLFFLPVIEPIQDHLPLEMEMMREMGFLRSYRARGSHGLSPSFFKDDGGEVLTSKLTKLLRSIWEREKVPKDRWESVIVLVCRKGDRSSCENQIGISLVSIASKLLAAFIVHRLSSSPEVYMCENHVSLRPSCWCSSQMFTLRQILEHRHDVCPFLSEIDIWVGRPCSSLGAASH